MEQTSFGEFVTAFFAIFTLPTFRGEDYLHYLARSEGRRRGDEASIVDTAIVGPLLNALGFRPAEHVYNRQHETSRPDFAPEVSWYGTCFVIEDKSTASTLTLDLTDPDSHLNQLRGYLRASLLRLGWLTNGRTLLVWRFVDYDRPSLLLSLDIQAILMAWESSHVLTEATEQHLHNLFDLFRRDAFIDTARLEDEIALSFEDWRQRAVILGAGGAGDTQVVEAVQALIGELHADARDRLSDHLSRYDAYTERITRLDDADAEPATARLSALRAKVLASLDSARATLGFQAEDREAFLSILTRMEHDASAFHSLEDVEAALIAVINRVLVRERPDKQRSARPIASLDHLGTLKQDLEGYTRMTFAWHQRQSTLRNTYRAALEVHDDYITWTGLVRETLLGGLDEQGRRHEFALQAAYVVFIRLLLIRVCEDKGILPQRFISDGGFAHWQREDIPRYQVFTNGNPYAPLLDMAYSNAQNIYAHFFTGRELFNWYRLDRQHLIMALHRLSRFDFAAVDSDIIGTIYNTYVDRKEKRQRGQYYTPPEIVAYMLDSVGYVSGPGIIGPNRRLIDPACGSGSFLVTAAKRLVHAYRGARESVDDPEAVLDRVRDTLFGFDLNPFACYLAEVNLLIQVLDLVKLAHDAGKRPKLQRFHIYNTDALMRPGELSNYASYNTVLAEESAQADRIKRRVASTPYAAGFAFVIANPPYGAALSNTYKNMLRLDWAEVFHGQPDTYTFFLKLGLELLARGGRLGYITPNTYLMGIDTKTLRRSLLLSSCIEQIVDLPQGIWPDANVDCALIFLRQEDDVTVRGEQRAEVHLMGVHDSLNKLTTHAWAETLVQAQARWLADPKYQMDIRYDPLLQRIEDACRIPLNGAGRAVVRRLGDITHSTQGIIPYKTKEDGKVNRYIRPRRAVPHDKVDWKPLLDGTSYIGRYDLRWSTEQPYLKYGKWLGRPREPRFFDEPKLLVQDMRNRGLRRRLVATLDDTGFYNRHNFSNIIANDTSYDLRYLLALFNSSVLNFWFARRFDNVHVNPSYFRQLPIVPTDPAARNEIAALVDELLAIHTELNAWRRRGYMARQRQDGAAVIEVPFDVLLATLQQADPTFPAMTIFDARAAGVLTIPDRCDLHATVSSNVYIPSKVPTSVVLRHQKLWLEVADDGLRRYLVGYFSRPAWQGKTWDDFKLAAILPADDEALSSFFAAEAGRIQEIRILIGRANELDAQIDERVLDLYGITDAADRHRVLSSAPRHEDLDTEGLPDDPAE